MIAVAGVCPIGRMIRRSLKMCSPLCAFDIPATEGMADMVATVVDLADDAPLILRAGKGDIAPFSV